MNAEKQSLAKIYPKTSVAADSSRHHCRQLNDCPMIGLPKADERERISGVFVRTKSRPESSREVPMKCRHEGQQRLRRRSH